MTKWGYGCGKLYSQQGQVGQEDPHSLSGHELPADESEIKASENYQDTTLSS